MKKNNAIHTKKTRVAMSELLSREDYLVVQANDLAQAFGGLSSLQHRVLDYCFSFVTKDSQPSDEYTANAIDILHLLGMNSSGANYERIAKALKALNEKTALYFKIDRPDGTTGIRMAQLFSHIDFFEDGKVKFLFSSEAAPYVFELRKNFYSFKLRELSRVKSKYSLILLKLWESHRYGNESITTISGSSEDWQGWFLGSDRRWPSNRFNQKVLNVAMDEINQKMGAWFVLEKLKRGRSIEGYVMTIHAAPTSVQKLD